MVQIFFNVKKLSTDKSTDKARNNSITIYVLIRLCVSNDDDRQCVYIHEYFSQNNYNNNL